MSPGGRLRGLLGRREGAEVETDPDRRVVGPARLGKRTKDLVKRLEVGEIAIIDHADLDRIAAEDLAASRVAGVINVAPFSTGRYPNVGPLILARSGVVLVEAVGAPLFESLDRGDVIELDGGDVLLSGTTLANGTRPSIGDLEQRLAEQRSRIDRAIAEFATNTIEHVRVESELLSGEIRLPQTRTRFDGRHVLIVVRGPRYREDLAALNAYIRDVRPLIIGVDGCADAVLRAGLRPDVILGDMDSATDKALRCGAELIVHAYPDGSAPGHERLEDAGLDHLVIPAPGTSQDVAMLLANEKGASLIVMVGAHFNLLEFLDKNRAGMSSTFLTRLRVGETLVDAKGVSRLYRPGIGAPGVALFALAFVLVVVAVIIASPGIDNVFQLLWIKIKDAFGG
ncbi:MAG TPA: putative cytokinetic ring protein SteA [Solirubrobacterales bacterium]|nr:putative cytokinetic ring protein SteA [Solirubrobacterales bacterium]